MIITKNKAKLLQQVLKDQNRYNEYTNNEQDKIKFLKMKY
jgi:hypothetical protein